jgi:probable selenate reductase FAD-binding subunit
MSPSYHRPSSVAQAVQLKAELGSGAVFLAGGTEVNNGLAARPAALIDLADLGLDTVEISSDGIRLGAGVTMQQLVEHPELPWFLKAASRQMANRNIRNRATVGGQLGTNRSCADLIPTLLAAQAKVSLVDRELPVERFIEGPPELILSVFVPMTGRGFGLDHLTRTASDISVVAASASLRTQDGCVQEPILAVGGVAAHVVRLSDVEQALDGKPLPEREQIEELVSIAVNPIDDLRGTAAFKRHIAAVLGARALHAAAENVGSVKGGH